MPLTKLAPHRDKLIIVLFSALLMMPAFLLGSGGKDLQCQSLWTKLFAAQLWSGELYPRWIIDMFAGNGSPVFFYYPPLVYYITSLFASLSSLDFFGYYTIAASATLAVILSGVVCYVWLKGETDSKTAALLGSLLYIAAPFNLAQNFYYALLLSSVWAYVWLPLLLMYAKRLMQGKPYSAVIFAILLCLLILTNLPMTMICSPFVLAYSALYFTKGNIRRQSVKLIVSVLFGFALSAFYLLPALSYINFANVDIHWILPGAPGGYTAYFLDLGFWDFHHTIYTVYWLGSVVLICLYFSVVPRTVETVFFALTAFAACFMVLLQSKFIWEALPILKALQMPIRFFVIPSLCLAWFVARASSRLKWFSYALLILYTVLIGLVAYNTRMSEETYRTAEPIHYESYMLKIDQYSNYLTTPNLMKRYYEPEGIAEVKAHLEQVEILSGDAKVEVKQWKPRSIVLHYKALENSTLRVRQFDFPGFRAFVNGKELDIKRDDVTGQIVFDVPEGEGDIQITLTKLLHEIAGDTLSFISALLALLCILLQMRQRKLNNA